MTANLVHVTQDLVAELAARLAVPATAVAVLPDLVHVVAGMLTAIADSLPPILPRLPEISPLPAETPGLAEVKLDRLAGFRELEPQRRLTRSWRRG